MGISFADADVWYYLRSRLLASLLQRAQILSVIRLLLVAILGMLVGFEAKYDVVKDLFPNALAYSSASGPLDFNKNAIRIFYNF